MRSRFAVWLAVLAACGSGVERSAIEGTLPFVDARDAFAAAPRAPLGTSLAADDTSPGPDVAYSDAVQKSSHNAYAREEPIVDQLLYHRIRSLELDVHVSRAGSPDLDRDWFVYHEDMPFFRETSCATASACLGQVAAFHRAVPHHEVTTLFVDLKDGFSPGHMPADLDAVLVGALGRGALFTPEDAMKRCLGATSLRDALAGTCSFPTLAELRGRIVLAVTGGSACDASSPVRSYGGADPLARVAFLAPNVDAMCPVATQDADPNGPVFVNMDRDGRDQAAEANARGLVARIYRGGVSGGLDTRDEIAEARAAGARHLATDKASADFDPWAATHDGRGFPFACAGCAGFAEPGDVLGIRASTGDLWGSADSAFFALAPETHEAEAWTALASVPSSHVEPFAKACVVARASDAPDAAYAAVCRTFDRYPPRMQVRAVTGGETTALDAPPLPDFDAEVPALLRLVVAPEDASTTVRAEVSADGARWVAIGTTTIAGALPARGLAVSSHDRAPVKALFAGVTRARRGAAPVAIGLRALPWRKGIGAASSGEAFAGVSP